MPWITLNLPSGPVTAHYCTRGQRVQKCKWCANREASKLCDFPVGKGRTCDMPICDRCATAVGEDRDHCPKHKGMKVPAEQDSLFGEVR